MAVCNALMLTPTLPELAAQVDAMGGGAYGQVYAIYNFFYSRTLYNLFIVFDGQVLTDCDLFVQLACWAGRWWGPS